MERSLALVSGVVGVAGLVFGCVLLIRETRLTVQALREEASLSMRKSDRGGAGGRGDHDDVDDGSDPARERNDDAIR